MMENNDEVVAGNYIGTLDILSLKESLDVSRKDHATVDISFKDHATVEIKVYKRRIWMLFLFSFLSMLCGMLFTHYTSMANVNSCFYSVGQEAVNWTGNIILVVYIVLVFPVSSLIDYMDLRWTVLCSSFCNTAGEMRTIYLRSRGVKVTEKRVKYDYR